MRLIFLSSVILVGLAGCAAQSEDVGSQSDDVVASVWTQDEALSTLGFQVNGSGDVPPGSACAPGAGRYTMITSTKQLAITECVGSPLRERVRYVKPTDEQWVSLVSAARSVRTSDATTCDTEAKAEYATMVLLPANGGTFPSQNLVSDHFGCDGTFMKYASGIENVIAELRSIAAAFPLPPVSVFTSTSPTPPSIWSSSSTTLILATVGSGEMPAGSTCIPGSKQYTLSVRADAPWTIYTTTCTPAADEPDARHTTRGGSIGPLTEVEKVRLQQTLTSMRVASSATCAPDAGYATLLVGYKDAAGATSAVSYRSRQNACLIGLDSAPYADLTALRTTLEQLEAAH